MVKTSKKTASADAMKKEYLTHLGEKVQRKNLQIVKQENLKRQHASKRCRSSEKEESESETIAKKCYQKWLEEEEATKSTRTDVDDSDEDDAAEELYKTWKRDEYDTCNPIDRKTLLSNINMFEDMMKTTKKDECGSSSQTSVDGNNNKIMWTSPTYVAQYIRKCILRQAWSELAHLLLLLKKHSHLYESYIKEMAFLTALKSVDECSKDLLSKLELCFVTEKMQERKEFDVWYVEKLPDDTNILKEEEKCSLNLEKKGRAKSRLKSSALANR